MENIIELTLTDEHRQAALKEYYENRILSNCCLMVQALREKFSPKKYSVSCGLNQAFIDKDFDATKRVRYNLDANGIELSWKRAVDWHDLELPMKVTLIKE